MRDLLPTRRDAAVALLSAAAALAAAGSLRSQDPVLRSTALPWAERIVEPTSTGERRPFLRSRTATLESLSVHATTVNPGTASHPPHRHPDEEMVLVKEGIIEQTINGESHRLGAGSVAFIAPGDEHGLRNAGDTPATYYIIRWVTEKTPPR